MHVAVDSSTQFSRSRPVPNDGLWYHYDYGCIIIRMMMLSVAVAAHGEKQHRLTDRQTRLSARVLTTTPQWPPRRRLIWWFLVQWITVVADYYCGGGGARRGGGGCAALVTTPSAEHHHPPSRRTFPGGGIRLNKVFKATHSRRQADALIAAGRVSVNGVPVNDNNDDNNKPTGLGMRVIPYQDSVELDGQRIVGWEEQLPELVVYAAEATPSPSTSSSTNTTNGAAPASSLVLARNEEYIKYWKPVGITSTTDRSIPGNLLDELLNPRAHPRHHQQKQQPPITQRIFSVGRLDKDSSGLLLLTSDGRVPNAVLRKQFKRPKTYHVVVDQPVADAHLERLRRGLVITTDTVRQGKHRSLTARTLPCRVERISMMQRNDPTNNNNNKCLQITLTEGRNRQIRVMLQTLGYQVRSLHRTDFMGIGLQGLARPGDWVRLTTEERQILWDAVTAAAAADADDAVLPPTRENNNPPS